MAAAAEQSALEDTWTAAELTKHIRKAGHGGRARDLRDEERERRRARDLRDEERERRRTRDNKDDEERERRGARDNKDDEERERRMTRDNKDDEERERRGARDIRDDEVRERKGTRDNKDEERERRRARDIKDEERERRRARDNKDEERERRRGRDKNKEEESESRKSRDTRDEERDRRRARDTRDERQVERTRGGAEEGDQRRSGGGEERDQRRRVGGEEGDQRRRGGDADTKGPDRDPQRERHKDRAREREGGEEREKRGEERERDRRRGGGREREGGNDREEKERRKEGDGRQDQRKKEEEEREKENNEERTRDRERRKEKEEKARRREEERRREKEERGGRDEERERRRRERRQQLDQDHGESREHRDPEEAETRHHGDREIGDKERRRARIHPVLPDAEPPEPGPEVLRARRTSERKAAAEPEQTVGEIAYEDDFEEYQEDFEELDESGGEEEEGQEEESPRQEMGGERRKEVEAIQRAMEEENRRAGTAQRSRTEELRPREPEQNHQGSPHPGSHRSPQRGKFIDFVAAKQREISQMVASKQKRRSADLLRLVDLDFSPTFLLLDLPPLSEYDIYIKSFGNTNTKQAYVQCREDDGVRDVQTDLIQVLDKWTQHPADHTGACGDPGRSQDAMGWNPAQINIDSQRLAMFLHSAAQVVLVLLEEDHAERQSLRTTTSQTDALSFSEGSLQLNTQLPFLYGRPCSQLLFSSVRRQTLLSVHGPLDRPGAVRLDGWALICVWNIWEPSRPQKILVYESEVSCCCFSPGSSALVLAGTSDGSLLLWDLREGAGSHHHMTIGDTEWTFRQPTFSTDAIFSTSGHLSAVRSIEVLHSSSSSSSTSSSSVAPLLVSEGSAETSFQLASLDERGVLNLWVVLELPAASPAGSQTDLGLRPGGRVKLLHSSCLPAVEGEGADLEALHLHVLPGEANHFLVTTNMGAVHHGTTHGFRPLPRSYRSQEVGSRPLHVTSVHLSPFNPQLFLVGCADGSMRLHVVSSHWPLAEWTACSGGGASDVGVVSVRWSESRPTVFCVLDSASRLHLWDLSRDPLGPVATETLQADRVTAMAVFGSSSSHQKAYSGVALARRSGGLTLHYFNPTYSSANHTEEDILQSMMHQAF